MSELQVSEGLEQLPFPKESPSLWRLLVGQKGRLRWSKVALATLPLALSLLFTACAQPLPQKTPTLPQSSAVTMSEKVPEITKLPANRFLTGVNMATAPSYGYKDLRPRSSSSDINLSLEEIQRMQGSLVRVFVGNNQISDDEAATRLDSFLSKAAQFNISVIPAFIDYHGGPWDRQSMVRAYTNAACPRDTVNVDLTKDIVTVCDDKRVKTWSQLQRELLGVGYGSGYNSQGTDHFYVRQNDFGVLSSDFFTGGYKGRFTDFMERVISRNRKHSNIYAWQVGNELRSRPDVFVNFMQDRISRIKTLDPNRKVASGMGDVTLTGLSANEFYSSLPNLDIITVHAYDGDRSGTEDVRWARKHGRVALIEEIGFSGSNRPQKLRDELEYWINIGASGALHWGFVARDIDTGDEDGRVGFDNRNYGDYDQIFSIMQSYARRQMPSPLLTNE